MSVGAIVVAASRAGFGETYAMSTITEKYLAAQDLRSPVRKQSNSYCASVRNIVASQEFARGLAEVRNNLPFNADNDDWDGSESGAPTSSRCALGCGEAGAPGASTGCGYNPLARNG